MHGDDHPLGPAIRELNILLNDPRYDQHLMREAGLTFDPAFMPLLVRLGAMGEAGVVELAGQLGRDHSTISRQMGRLEEVGLLRRVESKTDGRVRTARLTAKGVVAFRALGRARTRLLNRVLKDWSEEERREFGRLLQRFVKALQSSS